MDCLPFEDKTVTAHVERCTFLHASNREYRSLWERYSAHCV